MGNKSKILYLFILCVGVVACSNDPQFENYHLRNSSDLTLTDSTHPHGFSRSDCFSCHVLSNIHMQDRLGSNLLPLARSQVKSSGVQSCSLCHGTNGVSQ